LVRLRVVDHADLHGGRAVVVGDALRVDQVPDAAGSTLREADVGAGDRGDRQVKHQPLQWNIGSVQRYFVSKVMPVSTISPPVHPHPRCE